MENYKLFISLIESAIEYNLFSKSGLFVMAVSTNVAFNYGKELIITHFSTRAWYGKLEIKHWFSFQFIHLVIY